MAEKKVSLLCPTCGKDQFESLDSTRLPGLCA